MNKQRAWWLFIGVLPFFLALGLYGFVVRLPFFSDDIEFYTYLAKIQPLDILTHADANGLYWRPIPNLFYYFMSPHAPTWHLIVLATHVVGVALIGALTRQLRLGHLAQWIAMSIFAVFPFAVQAVTWVLSWGHVLSTTLMLASVVCLLRGLDTRQRAWLIACVVCGCLAPLTHENGILTVPVLMLFCAWWVFSPHPQSPMFTARLTERVHILFQRGIGGVFVPITLVGGLYWVHRSSIVTSKINIGDQFLDRFVKFLAYFAQGFSLPVQLATNQLSTDNTVSLIWLGMGAFLLVAFIMVLSARDRQGWWVFVLAVLWWFIASLPTVIALPPHYNIQFDERLLYVTLPALAVFYGLILSRLRWQLMLGATTTLVAVMVVIATIYAQFFGFMGEGWNTFFAQLSAVSPQQKGLVINFPRFMEYDTTILPMLRPNTMMMQIEFPMRDIVWTNTRQEFPNWQGVTALDDLQTQTFPFRLDVWKHYIGYGDFVVRQDLVTRIPDYDVIMRYQVQAGHYVVHWLGERLTEAVSQPLATFGNALVLEAVNQDAQGTVSLSWQKIAPIGEPWVAFVHVLCDDQIIAQSDQVPLDGLYGFEAWVVGDRWREFRYLDVPNPDCKTLRVGVYRASDGQRLTTDTDAEWIMIKP